VTLTVTINRLFLASFQGQGGHMAQNNKRLHILLSSPRSRVRRGSENRLKGQHDKVVKGTVISAISRATRREDADQASPLQIGFPE
jgi:hypothetical protein